jgi:hypothetical protein
METLEDAAKNKYPIENTGAMFMPNRHDVNKIYRQEGFIEGAKWQEQRMYSEEDLREAFRQGQLNIEYDTVFGFTLTLDEEVWFERWKKK